MIAKQNGPRIAIIDKHNAIVYHKDGTSVNLYSDVDVRRIIQIVCLPIEYKGNYESYVASMEDTVKLRSA